MLHGTLDRSLVEYLDFLDQGRKEKSQVSMAADDDADRLVPACTLIGWVLRKTSDAKYKSHFFFTMLFLVIDNHLLINGYDPSTDFSFCGSVVVPLRNQ
jgi:hypothetical protein